MIRINSNYIESIYSLMSYNISPMRFIKLIFIIFSLFLSFESLAEETFTYEHKGTTLRYSPTSDKTCMVFQTKVSGDVEIPEVVENGNATYTVTSIIGYAFQNCTGLTSIIIPRSVTSIGDFAFCYCIGLTSIKIPNSVTTIGTGAFSKCTGLTSVEIPNSVSSIASMLFNECTNLKSINIPSSVITIGTYAFQDCKSLTEISIPNSVKSIEFYAFVNTGLVSINIPESVTSIGSYAFSCCPNLTDVKIPGSVKSIGTWAFSTCTMLKSVVYDTTNPLEFSENIFIYCGHYGAYPTLYVRKAVIEKCKGLNPWKQFRSITSIEPTNLEGISDSSVMNAKTEFFNLNGNKIVTGNESLAPGIYIIRQGKECRKIRVY